MRVQITEWNADKVRAEMSGRVVDNMDKACQFVRDNAQGRVRRRSGTLAANIDYEIDVWGDRVSGFVGVRKGRAYYGWFVEVGTKGHKITVSRRRALSDQGTMYGRVVRHPGTAARPFLRPAIFENGPRILRLIGEGR